MIEVTLVCAPAPREVKELTLSVPEGSDVLQALSLAGWESELHQLALGQLFAGIWGRGTRADVVLREGDRVELCRPLRVDPKVARRERFVGQGARNAGLFAQRRPHSKAGY